VHLEFHILLKEDIAQASHRRSTCSLHWSWPRSPVPFQVSL
jgi:hypothetical protein